MKLQLWRQRRRGARGPKPEPKPNEVLIRCARRASTGPIFLSRRATSTAARWVGARIGLECSGEVEAVGAEVKDFRAGDRVLGSASGGFAQYVVTDAGRVHRIPGNNMTMSRRPACRSRCRPCTMPW